MPTNRPSIPESLRRKVFVEARHRCAICHSAPLEIAHIEPWSKVREHTFENLIALCPNCHTRADRGEIDKGALRAYKNNLAVVNDRYSDFERRLLETLAVIDEPGGVRLQSAEFQLMYLLKDGLIEDRGTGGVSVRLGAMETAPKLYVLTPAGREFVDRWINGKPLA